ncbi:MAG: TetR/AcrR family transcriptional regulator [Actinomycetota bacterium]
MTVGVRAGSAAVDMVTVVPGIAAEPTRTRGYKKKERTRRTLIQAAVDEIAEQGEAFTILDITKRAEVSNGTFYNHFDDRDALVDAVVEEVIASFVQGSAELVDDPDPVRRFATITALLFEHATANPRLATVLLRLHSLANTDTWPVDPFRHMRDDLTQAHEEGRLDVAPNDATIDLVTGTAFRAVLRLTTADTEARYVVDIITSLLRSFGLAATEAATIAGDAVARAPDLNRTYRPNESGVG